MTELKNMSDQELALRMLNYIERLEKLMNNVSEILNKSTHVGKHVIDDTKNTYRQLKEEIGNDAHYVDLKQNRRYDNSIYSAYFTPSIEEAAAYGFTSSINSSINRKFYSSIEEAQYRIRKSYGIDTWKKIAQQQ